MNIATFRKLVRNAVAEYIDSEGCQCCQNVEKHKFDTERLGKLLNVPMYKDKSGYDFGKYKDK
jgi:hypothetical protein